MRDAGGVIGRGNLVADPQRVGRVEIQDAVILHEDLRHAVVGGGQEEDEVEADFERAGVQLAVPVGAAVAAEAEMPFADHGGAITGLLQCVDRVKVSVPGR